MFPSSSQTPSIMHQHYYPWTTTASQPFHNHTSFNRVPIGDHHTFHLPPPTPSPPSSNDCLFKMVVDGLQSYEGSSSSSTSSSTNHHLGYHVAQPGSDMFRTQVEPCKMTSQEVVEAKAIAASKSHSEAERRRRERINNHLMKLRSLLPNTTKTDKATLLAEVIQHVKELKQQTAIIAKQNPIPTENDELTINNTSDEDGRIVIKASLCCEDRLDLLPDLIKTLKMLRLRTLKAEITTLGRRVKNVLFITREEDYLSNSDNNDTVNHWINVIEEALKAVVEKIDEQDDSSFTGVKRQRTNNINIYHPPKCL